MKLDNESGATRALPDIHMLEKIHANSNKVEEQDVLIVRGAMKALVFWVSKLREIIKE